MNKDTISGKWNELKGEILTQWGKLTDDEIESTKGNLTSIAGLIQQRYGEAKDAVSKKLEGLYARYDHEASDKVEQGKEWLANKTEEAKQSLRDSKDDQKLNKSI